MWDLPRSGIEPIVNGIITHFIFIGRTEAEAQSPILWPPDAKNWLTGKDLDTGKDRRQEEKGTTEDEMVGWHHQLDGHEFEQAPGVGDGQGSVPCYSPWGRKELEMTVQLNWNINPKELQYKELITARCRLPLRRCAYRSPKLTGETKTGML